MFRTAAALASLASIAGLAFIAAIVTATGADALVLKPNGGVEIGGQTFRCPNEAVYLDVDIPSEGMYGPEGILLNPELMQSRAMIVRKFIFAHECAHRIAGDDESAADCLAAQQGARERWLDKAGLDAVCRDMSELVETDVHPSGAARCANIRRCFASVTPPESATVASSSSWPAGGPAKGQAFGGGASVSFADKLRRAAGKWRDGFTDAGSR